MAEMPIEWIHPHPKNPREQLTDIDELVQSVKAHGIMQNLTVVPDGNEEPGMKPSFTVIIGHRRLEAAKRAGLETVPVTIAKNLTDQDIQQIMLVENMQRKDLTPLEEAKGIQMCLDLGIPEATLAEKTGFSKATIKSRRTLLKFSEENVRTAFIGGASIQDFIDLDKIEDPKLRNDLLMNSIGTGTFRRDLEIAKRKDDNRKWMNKVVLPFLKQHNAIELGTPRSKEWEYNSYFYNGREDLEPVYPKDLDPDDQVGYSINSCGIEIYVRYAHPKPKPETEADKRQKCKQLLSDEFTRARIRRTDFIKYLKWMPVNQHETRKELLAEMVAFMAGWHSGLDMQLFRNIFDPKKKSWKAEEAAEQIAALYDQNPVKALITVAYMIREDEAGETYDWEGRFNGNSDKVIGNKKIYEFLEQFGFVMTAEERQLIEGTHPLYVKQAE